MVAIYDVMYDLAMTVNDPQLVANALNNSLGLLENVVVYEVPPNKDYIQDTVAPNISKGMYHQGFSKILYLRESSNAFNIFTVSTRLDEMAKPVRRRALVGFPCGKVVGTGGSCHQDQYLISHSVTLS